jgi:hypothetical protein
MNKDGGIAALIVKSKKHDEEMLDENEEHEPGLMAASEEIMDAVQAKDPAQLISALKGFIEMCKESEYEEDDKGEQE